METLAQYLTVENYFLNLRIKTLL